MTYKIAALYRFTPIHDLVGFRQRALAEFKRLDLCGSLLVAPEGVNGTLGGSDDGIAGLENFLRQEVGLQDENIKFSAAPEKPFTRLRVRLKKELITFKQPSADPTKLCGTYVAPQDWNDLISDPDVTVLDTRNIYETKVGTFDRAIDPNIVKFTDFADFVRQKLDPAKNKKIAMFCTGGIRCEKASAFMLAEGYPEVYHLKGGILKYLEEVPAEKSLWHGECFVFDHRVAVGHGLDVGTHIMCQACGHPLSPDDVKSPDFVEDVSCPYCRDKR